jgi:SAM-dependent methyltransferase
LAITTPRPADEQLGSYYLSLDYISHTNKAHGFIDKIYLLAREYTLKKKLTLISKNIQNNSKKALLDFGCGTGEFLTYCKSNGWKVSGVEPSTIARKKASEILQQPVNEDIANEAEVEFDVITLWHVLEHVSELDKTLQQLKQKLASDGTLFIAVPNHVSWDGDHYKEHWAGYDVPRHLWHFSRGNVKRLMEKNGLKVVDIKPMKLDSFYISLLSEKYKSGQSNLLGMIKAFFNGCISNIKGSSSGEYSSLIYIVKK